MDIKEKELMFRFAEWISRKNYSYYNPKGSIPSWFRNDNHSLDCNTNELYEMFLIDLKYKL